MSAKYKSPSFLLPNEINTNTNPLNTDGNPATGTGVNSLYSMDFDGGSKYVDCGTGFGDSLGTYTGDLSFSFWINRPTAANSKGILYFGPFNNRGVLEIYADTSSITILSGGNKVLSYTNTNTWDNICIIYKSGDISNSKIYLNGSEQSTTDSGSFSSSLSFTGKKTIIGGYYSSAYTFNGQIDEVAIFNRALNTTEIAALYGGTSPNIYPSNLMATNLNPIAYYPLGEQAQNTGYLDPNNPGSDISGSEWQFPNGVLQDYVMDFDGIDDYITIPNISLSGEFTLSWWMKRSNYANTNNYFFGEDNANNANWVRFNNGDLDIKIGSSNGIDYQLGDQGTKPNFTFVNNNWYNIVITRDSNFLIQVYANGLADPNYTPLRLPRSGATPVSFAPNTFGRKNTTYLDGQISNVAIWNTAITDANQIANIYNNGSPQTSYTVSPQNWWKLNADSVYTPSAPNYTTALDFNGSSNYIDFGNNSSLNISTSSYSISFWIKTNDTGVSVLSQKANNELAVFITSSKIQWNGPNTFFSTSTITGDVWKHICLVTNSSNSYIYINGVQDATVSSSQINSSTTSDNFRIGGRSTQFNYDGQFSNYALYNTDLSASQVSTLFNFGTPETAISFDPVAWWKLDDQTAITDSSGNGNTGTNNGAVNSPGGVAVIPSWKIPSALPITTTPNYTTVFDFPGVSNDYVALADPMTSLATGGIFTISTWVKLPATGALGNSAIINAKNVTNNKHTYRLGFDASAYKVSFLITQSNGTSVGIGSNDSLNGDVWYNLIVVANGSNLKMYINGAEQSQSASYNGTLYAPTAIRIAQHYTYKGFKGSLSNLQIFNTALNSSVKTIYNNGTPLLDVSSFSSLKAWWKFDTTATWNGSNWLIPDASSNSNNATSYSLAQSIRVSSNVLATQPVNGVSTTLPSTALQQSDLQFDSPYSNYSLNFDGATYVDCTNDSILTPTSAISISLWVKTNDSANFASLIDKWINTNTGYMIDLGTSANQGKPRFTIGATAISSSVIVNDGDWHHVSVTCDNTTGYIYVDGVQTGTGSLTMTGISSLDNLKIGGDGLSGPYLSGQIDETALWNTALTEAQVLEIYNNGRPKDLTTFSGTAPISWWRLGENAYFDNNSFTVPNSIAGAPNGIGSGTVTTMLSADAPGTYANGIGDGLAITDRVGDAPLSVANSQSYNMIPDDKIPYVPGYVGLQTTNAFEMTFDGIDDYFDAGNSISVATGNHSISFWLKYTSTSNVVIMEKGSGSTGELAFQVDGSGKIYWYGGPTYAVYINELTNDGNWHHVVAIADGSSSYMYLDGVLKTTAGNKIQSSSNTSNFYIGGRQTNYNFAGSIDEVAIFDKALTPDQIKFDLYEPTALVGGVEKTADIENNTNLPTPVAWYRMGD